MAEIPGYRTAIALAARGLRRGAVIAYPTEGVWGLGCDPENGAAVMRLLALKNRSIEKGLILLTDSAHRLVPFLRDLPDGARLSTDQRQEEQRPVTWLVEHHGWAPDWLSGGRPKLAVRITSHPVVGALCRAANMPLVSTSANPGGRPAADSALKVRSYFGNTIDHLVPGQLSGVRGASEIRDLATGAVLRSPGR